MDYWDWYRSSPRRPANGIKAQSKHFGKSWWASKWLNALEQLVDPGRLARGRSYARSGQVLNLDIKPGRVDSRVQGSRPAPYKVQIEIRPLSEKEWQRVADAMAEQAIFAAQLLAGEMPRDIEEAFASAHVNLFPASRGDLQTDCSCPDDANPCKHIAAVYYLLGEQFENDPFLLFRLRGKSKDEIIAMLRARRTIAAEEKPVAEIAPPQRAQEPRREKAPPLKAALDKFWGADDRLEDFHVTIEASQVDAASIKRLGTPGFWQNKTSLADLFAHAYHSITQAGLDAALGNESQAQKKK